MNTHLEMISNQGGSQSKSIATKLCNRYSELKYHHIGVSKIIKTRQKEKLMKIADET